MNIDDQIAELDPCPFCGDCDAQEFLRVPLDLNLPVIYMCVTCIVCGCQGPASPTYDAAAANWNVAKEKA